MKNPVLLFLFFPLQLIAEGEQSWYFSSYMDSCNTCAMEADVLECHCTIHSKKKLRKTRMHRVSDCPLDISNCNGKLTCGRCQ